MTVEAFEFPKVMLLLTAAALLVPLAPWSRPSGGVLRDPLRLGIVLFGLSAVVSTALSRAPWISLQGANESYFGLLTVLAYSVLFFGTRALCRSAEDARRLMLAPVVAARAGRETPSAGSPLPTAATAGSRPRRTRGR